MYPVGSIANVQAVTRMAKICLLISIGTLGACASSGEQQQDNEVVAKPVSTKPIPASDRTIIEDLAGYIAQIYQPRSTTLQVNSIESDQTLNHLIASLAKKGFGIQRVSADQGAHFVSYERDKDRVKFSSYVDFSVSVGAVRVARKYQLMDNSVIAPASAVRLSGSRVAVTVTDKPSSKLRVKDESFSQVQYVASLGLDEQAPMISLITPEIVQNIATQGSNGASLKALNSSQVEVNNLFYADQSTFTSVLDDHSRIYKYVVVFGNDSMVLGKRNKSLIDQLVDKVLIEDDIVSLVGCSNGPTSLEMGNEGLAMGRARRVTEALVARGVPSDNVLDEGCWAPTALDNEHRFPNRGVVLELWRKNP